MTHRNWLVFGMSAVLAVLPARSADKPGKDQAQTRRLQQQLRTAEQEKAQLAQHKADAESQLKDAQGKAVGAQRRADAATGRNSLLSKELQSIKAEKEAVIAEKEALALTSKAEQAALAAKLAETERKLAEQRLAYGVEKQQMEAAVAKMRTALSGCWERNGRMYKLGNELLEKYQQKSCFTSVLQAEPFTGLKRAQIQKMVEEDREKFDKDQLLPAHGAEAAAPAH